MRVILVAILGGCLIGLIVGCGSGDSTKIEKPTNPTPPPPIEFFEKQKANGPAAGGMAAPKMKPLPMPKRK